MVNLNYAEKYEDNQELLNIPKDDLKWSTISLSEIINKKNRLEASVFNIKGKHAREILKKCKWNLAPLFNEKNGFSKKAFYPGRFKRIYINKNDDKAIGFLGSAEMLHINPKPIKFISNNQNDITQLKLNKNYILISRSGTIGNVTLVSDSLIKYLVSEHAIRLECNHFIGYVYTFLKTKIGQSLIKSNIYGAVVDQIEPEHLKDIQIPNADINIKKEIHNLIMKSYQLRDASNDLINEAESLLVQELKLPPIEKLNPKYFDNSVELRNYSIKLSNLNNRLDGSYHVPIVYSILNHIKKIAYEVTKLGNEKISKNIVLPGRFKRVYVAEGQGVVFFGGKQLYELDPSNKKYLSLIHHADRIKNQLTLKENMIMITCSGTIGKVNIVSKHWENWTANQHIIRILPASTDIAGYIYSWLSTDLGQILIRRYTYGSVVDEIDDKHVTDIEIPLLKNKQIQQKINDLVLKANEKRYDAYIKEQEALKIMEDEVIYTFK